MRKLATVRAINEIRPIKDADRIELAIVDGWHVVVAKSDNFKVGDLVVYIEIDSILPEKPEYEFLRSRKFRVRTIKLRGEVSQGLVLPLSVLPDDRTWKYGDDVTKIIGVEKYDPELEAENELIEQSKQRTKNPIIKWLCRFKWFRNIYLPKQSRGKFPDWIRKTDEERIQNMPTLFDSIRENGIKLSVTEKVDGTSSTFFLKRIKKNKFKFGVCTRNNQLLVEDDSPYWEVARIYEIEKFLKSFIGDYDGIILQGEITGQKIQGNKYPSEKKYRFWAFNLITPEKRYSTEEMQPILAKYNIMTVPIVQLNYELPETIDDLVTYVQGRSQIADREREGCVFRNVDEGISFKCISPRFLLKEEEEKNEAEQL